MPIYAYLRVYARIHRIIYLPFRDRINLSVSHLHYVAVVSVCMYRMGCARKGHPRNCCMHIMLHDIGGYMKVWEDIRRCR